MSRIFLTSCLLLVSCVTAPPLESGDLKESISHKKEAKGWWSQPQDLPTFQQLGGEFVFSTTALTAHLENDSLWVGDSQGHFTIHLDSWGRLGHENSSEFTEPSWGRCIDSLQQQSNGDCLRRVDLDRAGLTEFWQPVSAGLEQGWEVHERPAGNALLSLNIDFVGALDLRILQDEKNAEFTGPEGRTWRYSNLKIWDANETPVKAWFERTNSGLAILIDDQGAEYPLFIDPILSQSEKILEVYGEELDLFGAYLVGGGDVNGDGYDDIIVSSLSDDDLDLEAGSVTIYLGSSLGIDETSGVKLYASDGTEGDWFGYAISAPGDINGDGYDDIVVGSPHDEDLDYRVGAAYVYYGSADGIDPTTEEKIIASDWAVWSYFGGDMDGIGDVNNDGFADVAISAHNDDDGLNGIYNGSVYIYLGSPSGLDTSTETKLTASDSADSDFFGRPVSGAGDINDDGYDDIVVGAPYDDDNGDYSGSLYVFYGSATGIDITTEQKITPSNGDAFFYFGFPVSGAGDVNQDGFDDILVGSFGADEQRGNAYIYMGSASGVDPSAELILSASDAEPDDFFGAALSHLGDVNLDGYDDIVIGAPGDDNLGLEAGAAYVYLGSSLGIDIDTEVRLQAFDGDAGDFFGNQAIGVGDIDNDGYNDLIVASPYDDDNGDDSGSIYVFHQECAGATWYADADGDGFGDIDTHLSSCIQPIGHVDNDLDCDDSDKSVYPGAVELCDGQLNDCDGSILSEEVDADEDGFVICSLDDAGWDGAGTIHGGDDCDDTNPAVNPDAIEVCDIADVDEDCSGYADDDDASATGQSQWYIDYDGDGYGSMAYEVSSCEEVSGYSLNSDDCDDTELSINPGQAEICDDNNTDEDCSGLADDEDATATGQTDWYADLDGDGYGDGANHQLVCDQPSGYLDNDTDCDDNDSTVYPAAVELCDGQLNDCDGVVGADEVDQDEDGYAVCSLDTAGWDGSGNVTGGDDCDDNDASVYPSAQEASGDGVDSDCDGSGGPDDDEDGDGLSWADEADQGTGDDNADSDDDGLSDGAEALLGTDPNNADTDGDGILDGDDAAPLTPAEVEAILEEESTGCSSTGAPMGGYALFVLLLPLLLRRRSAVHALVSHR